MSSLALAKRLKNKDPGIKILFGGSGFDCEMGLAHHRSYPDIVDHVFLGEADDYIVDIVLDLNNGRKSADIPGLTYYRDGQIHYGKIICIKENLDTAASPDYDDYFIDRRAAADLDYKIPSLGPLSFESSRGCWWAEKSQCSFCGINGGRNRYRSKSPSKVVSELEELSSRYATLDFRSCDTIIPKSFYESLFPALHENGIDYSLWYQTRTDLKKKEIAALIKGKVTLVQLGVESFSNHVLKLMHKGITVLENIRMLKWCQEIGMNVSYFILYGFPGEDARDYSEAAAMIPLITHLPPPHRMHPIEIHRFSPMFADPAKYGIEEIYMREDTTFIYPKDILDADLIYTFHYYSKSSENAYEYTKPLSEALRGWISAYQGPDRPVLNIRIGRDFSLVQDTRNGTEKKIFLNELQTEILLACDGISTPARVCEKILKRSNDMNHERIEAEITAMIEGNLILENEDRLLSLPLQQVRW
jgi:ribosomal peptide maturation radical SAM protein 1